jgi:small-conductance mechanosensitive channel
VAAILDKPATQAARRRKHPAETAENWPPGFLKQPEPEARFQEFGDSSLNFVLLVWTRDYITTPVVLRSELNFAISRMFKEHGIEVPFPQRDLHIRSGVLSIKTTAES